MAVLLETTLGDVVIDLYTEERPRGEARPAHLSPGGGVLSPRAARSPCRDPAPMSGPRLEKFSWGAALLPGLVLASGGRVLVVFQCVCVGHIQGGIPRAPKVVAA